MKNVGKKFVGEQRELYACEDLAGEEAPYDRLLGDAMAGDGSLFTGLEAVEAAWTAVDDILVEPSEGRAVQARHLGPGRGRRADRRATAAGRRRRPRTACGGNRKKDA